MNKSNTGETKVLIIEDIPEIMSSQERLLSQAGFDVYQATTGKEGLAEALRVHPDIILLDVQLPDTNGYLVCEMIKNQPELEETFVVFITGSKVKSEDQAKGLEMGAEGYITRPIPNRELLARVVSFERIKRTEKELRLARKKLETLNADLTRSNEDLQNFAYAISHDLQEPLRMISSYLSLLEKRYHQELDDSAREFIDFAVDGADRMKNMIKGVLSYSRVATHGVAFEIFSPNQACQQALDNLAVLIQENRVKIEVGDLPDVVGDQIQISQVFQNLINNAIKFNQDQNPLIRISGHKIDGDCQFIVEDNGIGIPEKSAERIFAIFQRLHTREEYPGTGMGLTICKRIIDRHGGQIWVESNPGQGSRFYFTLPMSTNS